QQAVGAGVALGLHGGVALRRDGHLDEALTHGPSRVRICRSSRAIERCCFMTALKARFSRVIQRASAARACARRVRAFGNGCGRCGWVGEEVAGGRTRRRRGAVMALGPLDDLELDAAVLERLLADGVAPFSRLDFPLLGRVT